MKQIPRSNILQSKGILGGTFDPVHCGHLRLSLETRERLGLDEVRLIPAPNPRLRDTPAASPAQRMAMLELALEGVEGLVADSRELERDGPTYSVETLRGLRADFPEHALCFLLGADAFARLDEWHRYEEILELAHLAVAHRPGATIPVTGTVGELLRSRRCDDPAVLRTEPAGRIFPVEIPMMDISATQIRGYLSQGRSLHCLVPRAVIQHIKKDGIYRYAK